MTTTFFIDSVRIARENSNEKQSSLSGMMGANVTEDAPEEGTPSGLGGFLRDDCEMNGRHMRRRSEVLCSYLREAVFPESSAVLVSDYTLQHSERTRSPKRRRMTVGEGFLSGCSPVTLDVNLNGVRKEYGQSELRNRQTHFLTTASDVDNDSDSDNRKTHLPASDCDEPKWCLLEFHNAPEHLRFNNFILSGYRSYLPSNVCLESIFWLTNETMNIWTHLFGGILFFCLMFYDLFLLNFHASLIDKLIVGGLLVCFQVCMVTSALYHTFSCHSREHYECFLKYDLLGIAFSLLAIYLSGIYYAFWCHKAWCTFYISTVLLIFVAVLVIQNLCEAQLYKVTAFVSWALYGIVPTIHWAIMMGGLENPIVEKLLPRVINMYLISGVAFGFYMSFIPERFFPGRFDIFGSSHQLWHVFVVLALYYWHNTGILYIEYRMNHGCQPLDQRDAF